MVTWVCTFLAASVALASSASANSPPLLPPEPARLVEAERLVVALPLENALGSTFGYQEITATVTNNAIAWLENQHSQQKNETLKRIFVEKVRSEAHSKLVVAFRDTRIALVERYARQLSEGDLQGARNFALTPEGQAFLKVQLAQDVDLRGLVTGSLYDQILPDLPRILQSARRSAQVLEQVNRKE